MPRSLAVVVLIGLGLSVVSPSVAAQYSLGADRGKLLLTAGFSTIEGAGGGALATWALITGYGSRDSWGANVHASGMTLDDLDIGSFGAAVGVFDRLEVSATRVRADMTATPLEGLTLTMDVFGIKARVLGDAVYAQDAWLPQVAIGAQFKRHRGFEGLAGGPTNVLQLGALEMDDVEYFASATKVYLARRLLVNATLRYTRGNQLGLLGFGGERELGKTLEVEGSAAFLLRRTLAVGAEFRSRPDTLALGREDAAWDAFIAWAPSKSLSFVAGYANIGRLLAPATGTRSAQDGAYLSIQAGF